MLKHILTNTSHALRSQPPSGGCVLKRLLIFCSKCLGYQPPSGGCVLKPLKRTSFASGVAQPPSGGCVLKPAFPKFSVFFGQPAAFRRLCVETQIFEKRGEWRFNQPPSGGCVLKQFIVNLHTLNASQPPSGGCVLKLVGDGCGF